MPILQMRKLEVGEVGDLPTVKETVSGRVRTVKPTVFPAHDATTSC